MNLKHENGSAYVTITVIVVIALLGVLGYTLLSKLNLVSLPEWSSQTSKTAKKPDNRKTASFDKSFGIAMNFKYPNSWSIDKKHDGIFPVTANTTSQETFTLTSPDNKYSVVYHLRAGSNPLNVCDEKTTPTVTAIETDGVKGWKGSTLVRAISKTKTGKYVSQVGLVAPVALMHAKTGKSACQFSVGVLNVPSMILTLNLVDASIHETQNPDMNIQSGAVDQGVSTEKEVKQLFSGKSFDEAKAILLSTTLK